MTNSAREVRSGWWRTRDGTDIRIRDMDDGHIRNSMRMLERARHRMVLECLATADSMQGEMASYYMGIEADQMAQEPVEAMIPKYAELRSEFDRRGLK